MANLRTYDDVLALEPTTPELQLIEACKAGVSCTLGDGRCPDGPSPERTIRADILRYLILGGCTDCLVDGSGVWLVGGYISGEIDMSFETAKGATQLQNCFFDSDIVSVQSRFELVDLIGSTLQGWRAQGAEIKGNVFLDNTTATATVDLTGATIGGQLACEGAQFTAAEGGALNAHSAEIKGGVFLRNTTATATINLAVATIGGQLDCEGAQLTAPEGDALNAQRVRIAEGLYWRDVTVGSGVVFLSGAHAADLVDDPERWPGHGQLMLDGFTYDRIADAPTDAKTRIAWLKKGCYLDDDFYPQPFTQLAKVLRTMGHDADGRKVLAERERLLRQDDRERRGGDRAWWYAWPVNSLLLVWDVILRSLAGYGHHPFRTVLWLFVFWLIAVSLSHQAWERGDFAPASAVLQNSQEWKALAAMDKADLPNPAKAWAERRNFEGERFGYTPGQDWETFNRYAYAADLVIPIIDLGQTDAWGPSTERGDWGRRLWRYGFFLQIAGWIVTALGAAAITGIIRRD